jgi:hypothetical protein
MNTLRVINQKDFDNLTVELDSLAEDYQEFLASFVGVKETPYSLEYVYGRLFILKGYFDRALEGLDRTAFGYPVAHKLNGQLQTFLLKKALFDHRLRDFIRNCSEDGALQQKLKMAIDPVEAKMLSEGLYGRITLKDDDELSNLEVIDAITTLDDLRLHLDERKQLGLELAFRLQHDQASLEEKFCELEKSFWSNLPQLLKFRPAIKAYRDRFLIFQDKKYPWWYPEKRKAKAKPALQSEKANAMG